MDLGSFCVDSMPDIDQYLMYPDRLSNDQHSSDQERGSHRGASPDLEEALLGIQETSIDVGIQENAYSDISDSDLTGEPTVSKPSHAEFSDISDCETFALEGNEQSSSALKTESLDVTNANSIYSDISDTDDAEFEQGHASTISNQCLSTEYSDISDDNDTDRLVIDTRSCDTSVRSNVSVSFEMDSCLSQHTSMSQSSIQESDVIDNDKHANIQSSSAWNQSESNPDSCSTSNNDMINTLHHIMDTTQFVVKDTASANTTDIILKNTLDAASQRASDNIQHNVSDASLKNVTDTTLQNTTDKSQNVIDTTLQNTINVASQNLTDTTSQDISLASVIGGTAQNVSDTLSPAIVNSSLLSIIDSTAQNIPEMTTSQKDMDNTLHKGYDPTLQYARDPTLENITDTRLQNVTDPALQTIDQQHFLEIKSIENDSLDDNSDKCSINESKSINYVKETPQHPSLSEYSLLSIIDKMEHKVNDSTSPDLVDSSSLSIIDSTSQTVTDTTTSQKDMDKTSDNVSDLTLQYSTDSTSEDVTDTRLQNNTYLASQTAMNTRSENSMDISLQNAIDTKTAHITINNREQNPSQQITNSPQEPTIDTMLKNDTNEDFSDDRKNSVTSEDLFLVNNRGQSENGIVTNLDQQSLKVSSLQNLVQMQNNENISCDDSIDTSKHTINESKSINQEKEMDIIETAVILKNSLPKQKDNFAESYGIEIAVLNENNSCSDDKLEKNNINELFRSLQCQDPLNSNKTKHINTTSLQDSHVCSIDLALESLQILKHDQNATTITTLTHDISEEHSDTWSKNILSNRDLVLSPSSANSAKITVSENVSENNDEDKTKTLVGERLIESVPSAIECSLKANLLNESDAQMTIHSPKDVNFDACVVHDSADMKKSRNCIGKDVENLNFGINKCASKYSDLSLETCQTPHSDCHQSVEKDSTVEQHDFQATDISDKSHEDSTLDLVDNGQKLKDKPEIVYVEVISNPEQTIKNDEHIETNKSEIEVSDTGNFVSAAIYKSVFNVNVNKTALNAPEISIDSNLSLSGQCKDSDKILISEAAEIAPMFIANESKQITTSKDIYDQQINRSTDSCAEESDEMVQSKEFYDKQVDQIANPKDLCAKQGKQLDCSTEMCTKEDNEMISSKVLCSQYSEKITNSIDLPTKQSEQIPNEEDSSMDNNSPSISTVSKKSAAVRSDSTSSDCDTISVDSDVFNKDAEGKPFNAKSNKNKRNSTFSKLKNKKSIKKLMKRLKNGNAPSDVDWLELGVHRCRHCNFMTESLPILQAHACKIASGRDSDIASVQTSIIKSGGAFICSHCKIQSEQFDSFWQHFEKHLPKNSFLYKCCHCNVIFQLRGEAKIHSQSHLVTERKVEKIYPVGVKYIFRYMENGDWWRLHGLLRESLPSSVTPALVIENSSSVTCTANECTTLNSDHTERVSVDSSGRSGQKAETIVRSAISEDMNRDSVRATSSIMSPVSIRLSTTENINKNAMEEASTNLLKSMLNGNQMESVSLLSSTGQKSTAVVMSPIKARLSTGEDVNRYVVQNPGSKLGLPTLKSNLAESSPLLCSTGQLSTPVMSPVNTRVSTGSAAMAFQQVPLLSPSGPAITCRNLFPTNSSLTQSVLLYRADGSASSGILVPIQKAPGNSNTPKQVGIGSAINNNGIYVPVQSSLQSKSTFSNSFIPAVPLMGNKTQNVILVNPGIVNTAVSNTALNTNTANKTNVVSGTSNKHIIVLPSSSTAITMTQQVTTSTVSLLSSNPANLLRKALNESSPTTTVSIITKPRGSLPSAIPVSASLMKMVTVIPRTQAVANQNDDVMCNKIKRQFCLAKPLTSTHFIDHSKSTQLETKICQQSSSMLPERNNKNSYLRKSIDLQCSANTCDSSHKSDIEAAEENELGLKIAATFSLRKGPASLDCFKLQNKNISEPETSLKSKDSSSKNLMECQSGNTVNPLFAEVIAAPQRLFSTTKDKSAPVTTSVIVSKMTHKSYGTSKDGQAETILSYSATPLPSAVVLESNSFSNSSSSSIEKDKLHENAKPNSFYICAFKSCFESFETAEIFQAHIQTKHKYATVFPCAHCLQTSTSHEELFRHMAQHASPKEFRLFQCAFKDCSYFTNNITSFRNHCRIHHPDEENYWCDHCKDRFKNLPFLLDHFKLNLLKFIHCPYCSMKSTDKHDVLRHINGTHVGKPKQITVSCELSCKPLSEQSQTHDVDPDPELITMRTSSIQAKKDLLLSMPVIKTEPPDTYEEEVPQISMSHNNCLAVPVIERLHTYAKPQQTDPSALLDSPDNNILPSPVQEITKLCSPITSEVPVSSKSTSSMIAHVVSPAYSNSTSPDDSLGSAPIHDKIVASQMDKMSCMLCLKQFSKIDPLKKHLQVHSNKISEYTLFKCSVCSYHSMSLPPLARHWVGAHDGFGRMRFTKVQEKILPRISDSTPQPQSKPRTALDQPQAKLLSCPHCKFSCLAQNVMLMHIWQAHPRGNQEPDPSNQKTTSAKKSTTPKKQVQHKQKISQDRKECHEILNEKHVNATSKQIVSEGGNIPKLALPNQLSLDSELGSSRNSHILNILTAPPTSTAHPASTENIQATRTSIATDQPLIEQHSPKSQLNEQMSAKDISPILKKASPKTKRLNKVSPRKSVSPSRPALPSNSVSPSRPVLPSSKTPVPLECKYCIYEATRVIELSNHLAECHKAASVKCSLCTFRGKKLLSIIHHFYQIHGEHLDTIAYEIDSTPFVECAPDNVKEVSTKQGQTTSIAGQSKRAGYTFHYRCNICAHKCPKSTDIKTHIKKRHGSNLIREYSRFVPDVNTSVARTSPSKTATDLQNRLETTSGLQTSNIDAHSNAVGEKENDKDESQDSNDDIHESLQVCRFLCSHCPAERKYENAIRYHIAHTHGNEFNSEFTKVKVNVPSSIKEAIDEEKSPPLSFSYVYRCNICALRILSKQHAIQQHLRDQHGEGLVMEYTKYRATPEIIAQMQQVNTISQSHGDKSEKAIVKETDVSATKEISETESFLMNLKESGTTLDQNTEKDFVENYEDEVHSLTSKDISINKPSLEYDGHARGSSTIENRSKITESGYKCTVCQIWKSSFEEMKVHLIQSHGPVFEAECQKAQYMSKKDSGKTKSKEEETSKLDNTNLTMKVSMDIIERGTANVNNPDVMKSNSVMSKEGETPEINNHPVSKNISIKQKTKKTKVIPHLSNAKSMTINYRCNICAVKLKSISNIRDHLIETHGEHLIREYTRFRTVKDKSTDIVLPKENQQVYKSSADIHVKDSSASDQNESRNCGTSKESLITSPYKNAVTSLREETSSSDDNDVNDSQLSFNSDNSFGSSSSYRRLILKPDKRLVAPVRKLSFAETKKKSPSKHHHTQRPTSRKPTSNGLSRDPVVLLNKRDVDLPVVNVTDEDKVKQKFSSLVAKKFTAPKCSLKKSHLYSCNPKSIQMKLDKITKEIEEIRKTKAKSKKSRNAFNSNDNAHGSKSHSDKVTQNSRLSLSKKITSNHNADDDTSSDDSTQSPKKKNRPLAQNNDLSMETRTYDDDNIDADQGLLEESRSLASKSPSDNFDCSICSEVLANRHGLFRHYFIHLNYRPYVCAYCSTNFRTKSVLYKHTNKVHRGKNVYMKYERNEKKEKAARKLACYPTKKSKNINSNKELSVDKAGNEKHTAAISKPKTSSKDASGPKISEEKATSLNNKRPLVEMKKVDCKDENHTATVINMKSNSVKSKDSHLPLHPSPEKQNPVTQTSVNICTAASKAKVAMQQKFAAATAAPRSKPTPCLFLQHIMFHKEMCLKTLTEEQVCDLCEERFGNPAAVRHHLYSKHMPRCYKCPYCSFRSYPKGVVRKHVTHMHRDQPPVVVMVRDKAYFEFEKFYYDKYGNIPEVIRRKETYAAHQKRTMTSASDLSSRISPASTDDKSPPHSKCTVSDLGNNNKFDLGKKLSESLAKKIISNGKKAFSDMFKKCDSVKTDINSKIVPQKRKSLDCNLVEHPAKILHLDTGITAKHDSTIIPSPTPNGISNIFEMWTNSSQPTDAIKLTSCDFNPTSEYLDNFQDSSVSIIASQHSDCISISSDTTESDSDFDTGRRVTEKRTIFCCHLCCYNTPILSRFEAHLSNVENFAASNILHKCGFCRFTTENDAEFSSHVSKHIYAHPYFCSYCTFSSFYSKTVRAHCLRQHPDKTLKVEHRSEDSFHVPPRKKNVNLRPIVSVRDIMSLDPEEFDTLANDSGAAVVDLHDLSPDKVSSALRAIGVDNDSYSCNDDVNSNNNGDITDVDEDDEDSDND